MKVLVVEDSVRMGRSLEKGLTELGYAVDIATDGAAGLELARSGEFDLVLLDLNLPDLDGLALFRELRRTRSDVPVIMVTARDGVEARIEGLDAGADDYVTKPFSFEELVARIRAIMRRPGARSEPVLRFEDIALDPAKGQVIVRGEPVHLSAREFALLREFGRAPVDITTKLRAGKLIYEAGAEFVLTFRRAAPAGETSPNASHVH